MPVRSGLSISALLLHACLAFVTLAAAAQTTIRHVTVINVLTGNEATNQAVTIQGDRIAKVEPDAGPLLPGEIDAHNGFLIPGLRDMHVHIADPSELLLYVANGVTGIRVMSGDRNEAAFRAELAKQQPSPEIYLASAIVDGAPPVWPGSIVIKKPADARRAVDEIKAGGADFIKVYDRIPRNAYFALADEAKRQNIDFEGHVPDQISAQEASAAGQRSMEHLQGIAIGCSSQQANLMEQISHVPFFRDRFVIEAQAWNTLDRQKCQALLTELRTNGTWQVPTLTVRRVWGRLDDSHFLNDPRLAYIDSRSRDRWQERIRPQLRIWDFRLFQLARGIFSQEERMVGAMSATEVPLMAGTDAMNPYCFPGFSLHDELGLLVESGLSPLAALQAATINPARFLRITADEGTVEPGKIANLVLLQADPLADIHNTTRIEAVWLRGQYFDHMALEQMLDQLKQEARAKH